jgi:amino acid permease
MQEKKVKATQGSHVEPSLDRVLTTREILALACGAMIGFGWIVLSDNWIVSAGVEGSVLAFAFGSIATTLVRLTFAELASAMLFFGDELVYTYRAL